MAQSAFRTKLETGYTNSMIKSPSSLFVPEAGTYLSPTSSSMANPQSVASLISASISTTTTQHSVKHKAKDTGLSSISLKWKIPGNFTTDWSPETLFLRCFLMELCGQGSEDMEQCV